MHGGDIYAFLYLSLIFTLIHLLHQVCPEFLIRVTLLDLLLHCILVMFLFFDDLPSREIDLS